MWLASGFEGSFPAADLLTLKEPGKASHLPLLKANEKLSLVLTYILHTSFSAVCSAPR